MIDSNIGGRRLDDICTQIGLRRFHRESDVSLRGRLRVHLNTDVVPSIHDCDILVTQKLFENFPVGIVALQIKPELALLWLTADLVRCTPWYGSILGALRMAWRIWRGK